MSKLSSIVPLANIFQYSKSLQNSVMSVQSKFLEIKKNRRAIKRLLFPVDCGLIENHLLATKKQGVANTFPFKQNESE